MLTMKQWMEAVEYRITEGGEYYHQRVTYYSLDSWDGNSDGCSATIVFNPKTQDVMMVSVYDYKNARAYRQSVFVDKNEGNERQAYDEVMYTDVDVDDDMLDKLTKIMSHQPYDERVQVPLDISDETLLGLAKEAHKRDITINQMVGIVLQEEINRVQPPKPD